MASREICGKTVEFDEDQHLKDPNSWTEDIAKELAKEEGIEGLTDQHWTVINFMRKDYQENGATPTVRRITKNSGIQTKELYALFPKGPAKKASKIAGLPKPKGCI